MSFSISGDYYNVPKDNVQLVETVTTDAEGNVSVKHELKRASQPKTAKGGCISSVPHIAGGAYDYL